MTPKLTALNVCFSLLSARVASGYHFHPLLPYRVLKDISLRELGCNLKNAQDSLLAGSGIYCPNWKWKVIICTVGAGEMAQRLRALTAGAFKVGEARNASKPQGNDQKSKPKG